MTSTVRTRLITLAADDEPELLERSAALASSIIDQPHLPLDALADSLAHRPSGRSRLAFAATSTEEVAQILLDGPAVSTIADQPSPVVFLYPGVGEHHPGMVAALYETMPAFREAFDAVGAGLEFLVKPTGPGSGATSPGGPGLAALLEPAERPEWIDSPVVSQLAVFAVEYALTKLLSKVGLVPDLLCGYSVGEYAAATTAGVFGLEHVMTVLARRAELIERTAPAGMLTVLDSRERIADRLAAIGQPDLVVSAIDGPRLCVVSGPAADVDALTAALTAEGIATRRVPARHGFHSPMLRGIEADIAACVAAGDLHPPTIAMTSNTSGGRLAPDDAVDPRYWSRHASHPVLFDDHIDLLRQQPDPLLIEVGPGRMLTSLVLAKPGRPARVRATATLPEPDRTGHDVAGVLSAMGRAWAWGAPVDLPSVAAL